MRMGLFFLILLCTLIRDSTAQLRADRPLTLHRHGASVRVEPVFTPERGAWYHAFVQGSPLRMGSQILLWSPRLSCNRAIGREDARMCRAEFADVLFWNVYGAVASQANTVPGLYQGYATLTVQGAGEVYSTTFPVIYEVAVQEANCSVRASGRLQFGEADAYRPGSVTVNSETGGRRYKGAQSQRAEVSSHDSATLVLTTDAKSVTVMVKAPHVLQSPDGNIGFTSRLAYKTIASRRYLPLLEGSGSRPVHAEGGRILFRLGGTVTTYATSAEADYRGAVTVTFLCGQTH